MRNELGGMMNAPFGIADYGDNFGKSALLPLAHIRATRTLNESQHALIEDGNGRLITTTYRHNIDTELDVDADCPSEYELPPRTSRGVPGRETTAVRRRPTSVPRDIADAVMVALIQARQRIPRARLARWLGLTPRQVHLAELGSVQPDALPTLAAYFGIDLRAYTDRA